MPWRWIDFGVDDYIGPSPMDQDWDHHRGDGLRGFWRWYDPHHYDLIAKGILRSYWGGLRRFAVSLYQTITYGRPVPNYFARAGEVVVCDHCGSEIAHVVSDIRQHDRQGWNSTNFMWWHGLTIPPGATYGHDTVGCPTRGCPGRGFQPPMKAHFISGWRQLELGV